MRSDQGNAALLRAGIEHSLHVALVAAVDQPPHESEVGVADQLPMCPCHLTVGAVAQPDHTGIVVRLISPIGKYPHRSGSTGSVATVATGGGDVSAQISGRPVERGSGSA